MATKIFVNLPVNDLNKSMGFFSQLGYSFNPHFTDETAACMVISDTIYVMLLTREKFDEFTKKEIVDATRSTEVILCLSADNRDAVNSLVDRAVAAGGSELKAANDYGFMYYRSFEDLDGHNWEIMWMDEKAAAEGPQQPAEAMVNSQ
jgi:predicted lactoylglutathione lyase